MLTKLKISVLVDNRASGTFLGEHGLSFVVRTEHGTILFDTGQGFVIEHNMNELACSPEDIDCIVLSHGHYDHTGGLDCISRHIRQDTRFFLHPAALAAKFAKTPDGSKYIGIAPAVRDFLNNRMDRVFFTEQATEIFPDVFVTGYVPRIHGIEKRSTRFYLDKERTQHDAMSDDQSLFFRTERGTVVLLGCCHAGLANTLDCVANLADTDKIHAVIGGTHLRSANEELLDFAMAALDKYNVDIFAPCHCSGEKSSAYFYSKNPANFAECYAGAGFTFNI